MSHHLKLFSIFVAVTFFQVTCNNDSQTVSVNSKKTDSSKEVSSENNFSGKWSNVIPCADCPGIEINIYLNTDSTFIENMKYLERNSSFSDTGRWSLSNKLITISFPGKSTKIFYRIKSDSVIAILDGNKKEIKGALSKNYHLKKTK